MKLKTGLIGGKLVHSLSPQIHARYADYAYELYELSPEAVGGFLSAMKNGEAGSPDAVNVTIPYKKTVIPFLDELSPTAAAVGGVNTIVRRGGRICGYNTDVFGFRYLLSGVMADVSGRKALVLGSGGASAAVCCALKALNASTVVVSRSGEVNYENVRGQSDAAVIVNATPVGMYPDNGVSPLSLDGFDRLEAVADLIYNPAVTFFLADARSRGIRAVNGMAMLAAQAKLSSKLFLSEISDDRAALDASDMAQIASAAAAVGREMKNVLLVGMPGSGKTSVGRLAAQKLGREFIDLDEFIARRAGRAVPDIINSDGVEAFRRLESQALADVSKLSGKVIATGGGAVLAEANRPLLRQNSFVVWLRRPLELLPTDGRPLSRDLASLEAMYIRREPLYRSVCDAQVETGDAGRLGAAAEEVIEKFSLSGESEI